ncbi:MAG: NADH-quinone oxidoreductase subunit D, partial [Actinomycetota bacterium]
MSTAETLVRDLEERGHGAFVESYDATEDRMVINMGPVHPATHGVLRLLLELDGETVTACEPIIGYLHTGMEKECEDQNWRSAITIVTRMDYLSPFFNEHAYSLAVEQLLDLEVPPRGRYIRMLMSELNRLSSHLVWFGTQGLDMGAMSAMFYGFREREMVLDFYEMVTGLRMNSGYIVPGGVWEDLPDGWEGAVSAILEAMPRRIDEYEGLLSENPIFLDRTRGIAVLTAEQARKLGATGPIARAAGIDWDLRRDTPYEAYDEVTFDVPILERGDVYDRYRVRMAEMREALRIVEQVVDKMPGGDFKNMDPKLTPPPRSELNRSMEAIAAISSATRPPVTMYGSA